MTTEEKRKYAREYVKRKRLEQQFYVKIKCQSCGCEFDIKKCNEHRALWKGALCKICSRKKTMDGFFKYIHNLTPEEKSKAGKYARSKVKSENISEGVRKQWKTFRSNIEKYEEVCKARSERMKDVWKNYTEEKRNFIIKSFTNANCCGRSKISEKFKQELIKNNLYDGFVSEEIFHGFIPDEINHKLKIIIEVYGDLYHCNPHKYKNSDVFINAIKRTVGEQWKRDRIRLACFYKHGYTVVVIWESGIYKKLNEQIKKVKDEINKKRSVGTIL